MIYTCVVEVGTNRLRDSSMIRIIGIITSHQSPRCSGSSGNRFRDENDYFMIMSLITPDSHLSLFFLVHRFVPD